MVPRRIQAEQFHVEHMGQPGKGMPVGGMKRGDGPEKPFERQALVNHHVGRYIHVIIEVDEVIVQSWPVNSDRYRGYENQGTWQMPFDGTAVIQSFLCGTHCIIPRLFMSPVAG